MTDAAGAPAVLAERLSRRFGEVVGVERVDLRIHPGEILGLVGPNGAGKSTTVRMLSGQLPPGGGRALVLGHDAARDPLAVKAVVGVLAEGEETGERLTPRELVAFTGRMHGLGREEAAGRTEDLLGFLDVEAADRDRLLVDLSTGTRRKAALGCALVHAPRVLFLDEPLAGIDPVTGRAIRDALGRLAGRGTAILLCSHVIEVVEALAHRVAVLHRGRIVAEGTAAEIRAAAGSAEDAPLVDAVLDLLGGGAPPGEPSWLG